MVQSYFEVQIKLFKLVVSAVFVEFTVSLIYSVLRKIHGMSTGNPPLQHELEASRKDCWDQFLASEPGIKQILEDAQCAISSIVGGDPVATKDDVDAREKRPVLESHQFPFDVLLSVFLLAGKENGGSCTTEICEPDNIGPAAPDESDGSSDFVSPLFSGSYDWHSAVHGHWAILETCCTFLTRRNRDSTLNALPVLNQFLLRLSDEQLWKSEMEHLMETAPEFEMPYGRAWLLLLLTRVGQFRRKYGRTPLFQKNALNATFPSSLLYDKHAPKLADQLFAWLLLQFESCVNTVNDSDDDNNETICNSDRSKPSASEIQILYFRYVSTPEYTNPCWIMIQLFEYYQSILCSTISNDGTDIMTTASTSANTESDLSTIDIIQEAQQRCDTICSLVKQCFFGGPSYQGGEFVTLLKETFVQGDTKGFFSIWAVQLLLIYKTLGVSELKRYWVEVVKKEKELEAIVENEDWLQPVKRFDEDQLTTYTDIISGTASDCVHMLSVNASRAWGFYVLHQAFGTTNELPESTTEKFKHAYKRHLDFQFKLHCTGISAKNRNCWGKVLTESAPDLAAHLQEKNIDYWRYAYSHWVPQFSVYGIMLEHSALQ